MAGEERHREEQAQWFGENVRKNRERKGMNQDDVARAMAERGWKWHQSTVYKVEHGTRRTEAFEVADLAEILGVPMGHLFWPPAEVNENAMVESAIVMVRREWENAVEGVLRLERAIAWAARTLEQSGDSQYQRVRDTCAELVAELREKTQEAAYEEAAYRYQNPEEPR